MRNTADVTGGKPIAVLLQSISGVNAINPFTTSMEERVRYYYFILSRTPHETFYFVYTKHSIYEIQQTLSKVEL
jgi:hypothetical protein